jgi:hypothetical protein
MSNDNRGKLLIDNGVQLSLVRRIFLHWLAFIGLFLCIVLTLELFLRDPGVTLSASAFQAIEKNSLMLILMVAVMPAFLYDTVKLSNRFAGPITKLKNRLTALADGEPVDEITFRKGDFWGELAEQFNRVANRLRTEKGSPDRAADSTPGAKQDS